MKWLLFPLILLAGTRCTTSYVYVCDSKHAVKYHLKEDCRGLSDCQFRIVKVTLESVLKTNKTLCGWEQKIPNKPFYPDSSRSINTGI